MNDCSQHEYQVVEDSMRICINCGIFSSSHQPCTFTTEDYATGNDLGNCYNQHVPLNKELYSLAHSLAHALSLPVHTLSTIRACINRATARDHRHHRINRGKQGKQAVVIFVYLCARNSAVPLGLKDICGAIGEDIICGLLSLMCELRGVWESVCGHHSAGRCIVDSCTLYLECLLETFSDSLYAPQPFIENNSSSSPFSSSSSPLTSPTSKMRIIKVATSLCKLANKYALLDGRNPKIMATSTLLLAIQASLHDELVIDCVWSRLEVLQCARLLGLGGSARSVWDRYKELIDCIVVDCGRIPIGLIRFDNVPPMLSSIMQLISTNDEDGEKQIKHAPPSFNQSQATIKQNQIKIAKVKEHTLSSNSNDALDVDELIIHRLLLHGVDEHLIEECKSRYQLLALAHLLN